MNWVGSSEDSEMVLGALNRYRTVPISTVLLDGGEVSTKEKASFKKSGYSKGNVNVI